MAFKFQHSFLLFGLLSPGAMSQTKDLAIVGAHIETGDGKVFSTGVITIHNGKIASVSESTQVPDNTTVIDGRGLFVYPGFIDGYSTSGLKLPDLPASGTAPDSRTTAPASMWHGNRQGIRADVVAAKCLDVADRQKENFSMGITTAVLCSGSGSIRGIGSVVDYTSKGAVLSANAVGEISLRGGGGGRGYPGTLFGATALARQIIIDAKSYAANPPAKKDPGFENLKPLVTGQIPAYFSAETARDLVRARRFADEFGMKLIINGGREAYRELGWIKDRKVPIVLSVDVPDAPTKKMDTAPDATPQEVLDERYAQWEETSKNPKVLSEAEVPMAFGLGGGFGDYLKGVRKIVAAGLPREAALKAMTLGAAQIFGVADVTGSIQPGKLANLVILTGDFLDDKSVVKTVITEGTVVEVKKGGAK